MNSNHASFFLLTPPEQIQRAQSLGLPLAHLSYRLGAGGHLYRTGGPALPQGGLLCVGEELLEHQGDHVIFCNELLRECRARSFSGVFLDFESKPGTFLARLLQTLDEQLPRRGLSCYLPESYAAYCKNARLVLSSALSGGSLCGRLEEAVARHGAARLCLCLERRAEDFSLPAPQGAGQPLPLAELQRRIHSLEPSIFFSHELCAHYFTYMTRAEGAHFILFDDLGSLRKKLSLAKELGIRSFFFLHEQCQDLLPELLRDEL